MKRYGLLWCYPYGYGSGNRCLAEIEAASLGEAVTLLQPHCSVTLNSIGYAKDGIYTYVIGEFLS